MMIYADLKYDNFNDEMKLYAYLRDKINGYYTVKESFQI